MLLIGKFRVLVAGNDVTNRWNPSLLSASVSRAAREAADSVDLTLADPEGQTFLPPTGAEIEVHLGHDADSQGPVFTGFVDSTRWRLSKGSGRTLSVVGSSVDTKSKVKAAGLRSAADKSFGEVAKEWGERAGLDVTVAGDLGDVSRSYWIMQHESFMGWGQRTATELGASFKIIGRRAFFAPLNAGISASGRQLSSVQGRVGTNVIDVDITPVDGRPQYGKAVGRHYDLADARWREVEKAVKDAGVDVDFRALLGSANVDNASQNADAMARESERERGDGSATILGDHTAEPEAQFILSGARPGIDGAYVIDSLNHTLSKGQGFTTSLALKHPGDGAGRDTRA